VYILEEFSKERIKIGAAKAIFKTGYCVFFLTILAGMILGNYYSLLGFNWIIFIICIISGLTFWQVMWLWSKSVRLNEAMDYKLQILVELMLDAKNDITQRIMPFQQDEFQQNSSTNKLQENNPIQSVLSQPQPRVNVPLDQPKSPFDLGKMKK
jgi:hypothetical protein